MKILIKSLTAFVTSAYPLLRLTPTLGFSLCSPARLHYNFGLRIIFIDDYGP